MRSLATNGSWALRWVFSWSVLWFGRDYMGQKQPPYCLGFDLRHSFPRLIWYSAINYFLLRYTFVIQSLCSILIESLVFCYCWIWPELTPIWHTFFLGYMMFSYKLFPTNIYFVIQSLCSVLIEISGISLLLLLFMSLLLVLLKTVEFCCS